MILNEACFDGHALQCARGAVNGTRRVIETNGGIANPLRVHLQPGQTIYRFASSTRPHPERLRGCWWIDHEVLAKIARHVRDGHDGPRDAARCFLALPWSWTRVDRLIRARLVARLDAWRGVGKPAEGDGVGDAGTRIIPPQHVGALHQLYIPGLDSTDLWKEAFADVTDEDVWKVQAFA